MTQLWWLLATISLYISYRDITQREISNKTALLVLVLSGILLVYQSNYAALPYSLLILVVGFALHYVNVIAAGDVKLMVAFSLAIQPDLIGLTTIIIVGLGGVLAVFYFIYGLCTDLNRVRARGVPYGVPICLGSLFGIAASF